MEPFLTKSYPLIESIKQTACSPNQCRLFTIPCCLLTGTIKCFLTGIFLHQNSDLLNGFNKKLPGIPGEIEDF
jgi:hypothetical protein